MSLRRSFKEAVMSSFLRSCALNCITLVTELIKLTRKKTKLFRATVRLGNNSMHGDNSIIAAKRSHPVFSAFRMTLNMRRDRDLFHVETVRDKRRGRILVK